MGVFPKFINGDFQFKTEEKLFGIPIVIDDSIANDEIRIKNSNKILAIIEDEASKEEVE